MQAFTKHTGLVAPLDRVNVDTDQIIPKQFLKRIERTGFGQFLFYDWRFAGDGTPIEGFCFCRCRDIAGLRYWLRERISAADLRGNTRFGRWQILDFAS